MRRRYEYDDLGLPKEPPPYRRRRQHYGAEDDAWAAANEDDLDDDHVEIGDLAAGYVDHELVDGHGGTEDENEADWAPPPHARKMRSRSGMPPRYNRDHLYASSPSYHRDRAQHGEYGAPTKPKRTPDYPAAQGRLQGIPLWQILIVVMLSMFALLAMMLACVSILLL